jgi:uncharacterized protein with PQ loop repeat
MILDQIISAVVTVVGVGLSFSYYPQAWKIWKRSSAEDIALSTYVLSAVGTTTWFLYGLYKNDVVIMASFVFGVAGSLLVLLLTLYYRRRKTGL